MKIRSKKEWDQYNSTTNNAPVSVIKKNHTAIPALSYTHAFFKDEKLDQYLNTNCKKMVQLGAAQGQFMEQFKKAGWDTVGYDYSPSAISTLKGKGITTREVDLDAMEQGSLTYSAQLKEDISHPTNILLIRVLEYLEPEALQLLIFTLMDNAAPGSVFFLAGNVHEKPEIKDACAIKDDKDFPKELLPFVKNYQTSFFGARTDMEFLTLKDCNADDQLMVIRKR